MPLLLSSPNDVGKLGDFSMSFLDRFLLLSNRSTSGRRGFFEFVHIGTKRLKQKPTVAMSIFYSFNAKKLLFRLSSFWLFSHFPSATLADASSVSISFFLFSNGHRFVTCGGPRALFLLFFKQCFSCFYTFSSFPSLLSRSFLLLPVKKITTGIVRRYDDQRGGHVAGGRIFFL
jgi:hypothetical protein